MNPLAVIGINAQDPERRGGLSIFSHFRVPARNESGSSIAAKKLVYFSSYDAATKRFKIALADADDPTKRAVAITDHAIPDNNSSYVVLESLAGGENTSAGAEGDPVYESATAGAWTLTAPSGADQDKLRVGSVKTVSSTVGVVHFNLALAQLEKIGTSMFQAGAVSSASLDETLIRYASVSLTNTNMLALRATPVELVAAPGAGKVLEFISAALFFDYTAVYTESTDDMVVRYTDGSGVQVSEVIEVTGFLDATADTATNAIAKSDAIVAKTGCDNKALVIHNVGNGEYGGGNAANVVRVKVAYRVHSAGW